MDPYLIAQIEAGNHTRVQRAHMQHAQFAAQSRYQQQRSAYAGTSEHPCFSPLSARPYPDPDHEVDKFQVPESDDDRCTHRSSRTQKDEDPAESMRDKLARVQMMSGGLSDRGEQQSRRSSKRNGEPPYRAGESRRDHRDRHRSEPSLFSRRGGESSHSQSESRRQGESTYGPGSSRRGGESMYRLSSARRDGNGEFSYHASRTGQSTYRGSDHDLSDYRAETAAFPPTLSSARPSSPSPPNSSWQRPVGGFGRLSYDGRGISREYVTASRDYHREQGRNYRPEGRTHAQLYPYGEHGGGPSRPSGRPRC